MSWLLSDNVVGHIAVFEYLGQHVRGDPHGNSKANEHSEPFVRTPAATMDYITASLKNNRAQDVYNQLILNNDIVMAPRDSRVVRNKKSNDRQAEKLASGRSVCNNLGDEFQVVLNLIRTDNFVRRVVAQKDRTPSILLYTDRQVNDIKSFCFDRNRGSVLGFDKTYNLGAVYVTPCVYKNTALNRKRTNEHPVFLGPIFIHGRSDTDTYADFFGHLSAKFMGCDFQALTLGSDDERAMRKCMMHFFPRARVVVCSRHLHENVRRKLDELLGKSSDIRVRLLDALFGPTGLKSLDNVVSFDSAVDKMRNPTGLLSTCPKQFEQYFDHRVLPLMRDNCIAGRSTWTNNNCESMNHVLKQAIQWRSNQLPDLIDKLRMLVDGQYADADRAICGRGDYTLRPEWVKCRMTVDCWSQMTEHQRQKAIDKCFRLPGVTTSTSSNANVTVPVPAGRGRKLNQRKRSRAHKTVTVSKMAKTHTNTSDSESDVEPD